MKSEWYTSRSLELIFWTEPTLHIHLILFNIWFIFHRNFYYSGPKLHLSIEYDNIRRHKYLLLDLAW